MLNFKLKQFWWGKRPQIDFTTAAVSGVSTAKVGKSMPHQNEAEDKSVRAQGKEKERQKDRQNETQNIENGISRGLEKKT